MPKTTEKLDHLQLIRAFAMILVLFIHTDIFTTRILHQKFLWGFFTPGGDSGVDTFFVLSGFIIFYIHRQDIGKKTKLLPYLIKRFARIYPTYWVVNLFIIPLHFLFPQFGIGDETKPFIIFNSLFLIPMNHTPIIHAAWTLVYEILFYISFGFLIFFGLKKMKYFIIPMIIATTIGWFYSINNITGFQSSLLYTFFSYHNFEFLLGILGAHLITSYKMKFRKNLFILGVILFCSMLTLEYFNGSPIYYLRLFGYGISSFFIITALTSIELNKSFSIPDNLLYKSLIFLGNASFSIYLTHQVLISGIGRTLLALHSDNLLGSEFIVLTTIALTVITGSLFHLIVEKPLLSFSRNKLLSYQAKS